MRVARPSKRDARPLPPRIPDAIGNVRKACLAAGAARVLYAQAAAGPSRTVTGLHPPSLCALPRLRSLPWLRPATTLRDGREPQRLRPLSRAGGFCKPSPSQCGRSRHWRSALPVSKITPRARGGQRACLPWPPTRRVLDWSALPPHGPRRGSHRQVAVSPRRQPPVSDGML